MPYKNKADQRAAKRRYDQKRRHAGYVSKWKADHPERATAIVLKHIRKMKDLAFRAYGDACICCGESERAFLTFDHVNGGGHKHRQQIGTAIYSWMKKTGYPPTIQILCANCHLAKTYGSCPHKTGGAVPIPFRTKKQPIAMGGE